MLGTHFGVSIWGPKKILLRAKKQKTTPPPSQGTHPTKPPNNPGGEEGANQTHPPLPPLDMSPSKITSGPSLLLMGGQSCSRHLASDTGEALDRFRGPPFSGMVNVVRVVVMTGAAWHPPSTLGWPKSCRMPALPSAKELQRRRT